MEITEKKCAKCDALKSLDEFFRNSRNPDGRDKVCKSCQAARRRELHPRTFVPAFELGVKTCCMCGVTKSVSEFYKKGKNTFKSLCKECENKKKREYDAAHKEERRAKYQENRELALACAKDRYYADVPGARRKLRESSQRLRSKFLDMYGGACAICGETEREMLALDHVNIDGAEERRLHKNNMSWAYRDATKTGVPDFSKYRILCQNHNFTVWRELKPFESLSKSQKSARRLCDFVIKGYGGKCSCCGETNRRMLTLDHVNGGGCQHVKKDGPMAHYRDARDRNFPPEYRVYCLNCNVSALRGHGVCIHQRQKETLSHAD